MIEYVDDSGKLVRMNNKGHDFPEEATVQGNGNDRYFMVYPNKYSDSGTVTLYAENANDVKASSEAPAGFASGQVMRSRYDKENTSPVMAGCACDRRRAAGIPKKTMTGIIRFWHFKRSFKRENPTGLENRIPFLHDLSNSIERAEVV